jgi:proteasome lid subunit RPN8/RPN11
MIEISSEVRDELFVHAMAALPNEACGFLAGAGDRVERFFPVRNEDRSPVTYLMDARERFEAEDAMERLGLSVVGIFHSHTHTEAYPSRTDRSRAFWEDPVDKTLLPIYPGARYVIASLKEGERPLRAFTIESGRVVEEHVVVAQAGDANVTTERSSEELIS